MGAAKLVPLSEPTESTVGCSVPRLVRTSMPSKPAKESPPGALIVTVGPKFVYEALPPIEFVAATAITPRQFDGVWYEASKRSLPAAATIARVTPWANADAMTC